MVTTPDLQSRDHRRVRTVLRADPASAGRARRFVTVALEDWGQPQLRNVLRLLMSEAVNDAMQHSSDGLDLTLSFDGETIRVELWTPHSDLRTPDSEPGRGLTIVEEVADAWGGHRSAVGRTVWFELHVSPAFT